MVFQIFEVYGGFKMFAFILAILKFLFKAFLILTGLAILLFVQWEAHDFRIK